MDVVSPPYPLPSTAPRQLHRQLHVLYDWVKEQLDWANDVAVELEQVPAGVKYVELGLPPRVDPTTYFEVSVLSMYSSWGAMRHIREKHDELIRNFEDSSDWDGNTCVYHRLQLVKGASLLLSVACLDDEKRQAKALEVMQQHRQQFLNSWGMPGATADGESKTNDEETEEDQLWYSDPDDTGNSQSEPDE